LKEILYPIDTIQILSSEAILRISLL